MNVFNKTEEKLKNLLSILNDMGFEVNKNLEVEISDHQGLFSVDIIHNRVVFQPFKCDYCSDYGCRGKMRYLKLSLCIICTSAGWSNLGLNDSELFVLATIFAIASETLPNHVLNQIQRHCRRMSSPTPIYDDPYQIPNSPLFTRTTAKAFLLNHRIQFLEGRLPYSTYTILKERYEKFID